jgi:hypothetical protein
MCIRKKEKKGEGKLLKKGTERRSKGIKDK